MDKDCKMIIQEILVEAARNGKTITEDELIKKLDSIPGFWDKAETEEAIEFVDKVKNQ